MADPKWPTAVQRQRLIESSRTDREDGYEFTQSIGIEYENGVETIWTTTGRIFNREWGSEQVLKMSVTNMPPHMSLAHVPRRIERKITRGPQRGRGRFEVTFEDKFTLADGTVQFFKDTAITDRDVHELVDIPQSEVVDGLTATLERGESMEWAHPGKRLNTGPN